MKTLARLAILVAALGLVVGATAADPLKYRSKPGGKMRIEGSSTIHDWTSESVNIGGSLELDPSFPVDPANKDLKPGKVEANALVRILVRTFRCSSGSAMDSVMLEAMDAKNHERIEYKLTELVFKEFKDDAMLFDATGDLKVHGQTKPVVMPVQILRPDAKTLKIAGTTGVKMTDFGIQPPAPKILAGAIKTTDDIKLVFEWIVERQGTGG